MRAFILVALAALVASAVGGVIKCADGSVRFEIMDCPGGVVATFHKDKTVGPTRKQFKCADGSLVFDMGSCSGGTKVQVPHEINANAKPTALAADAAGAATAGSPKFSVSRAAAGTPGPTQRL